eukprot:276945_1
MMSTSLTSIHLILFAILPYCHSLLSPTSTSLNTEVYDAKIATVSFQNEEIVCQKQICQVYCRVNVTEACKNLKINATISNQLTLSCDNEMFGKAGGQICGNVDITTPPKTSAGIICKGSKSCVHNEFHLENTQSVTVTLIGSEYAKFYLDNVDTADIRCYQQFGCMLSTFYASNTNIFELNLIDKWSGYAVQVFASEAGTNQNSKVTISCEKDDSCQYLDLYCPVNENVECVIKCLYDSACDDTLVYTSSITATNLKLPYCAGSAALPNWCDGLHFKCMDAVFKKDSSGVPVWGTHECTGIQYDYALAKYVCVQTNEYGCTPLAFKHGGIIDPGNVDAVTIDCGLGYNCASAIIDFKKQKIATINCNNVNACYGMVVYGPRQTGATLNVNCKANRACFASYIDGMYVDTLSITCQGDNACGWQTVYFPDSNINTNYKIGNLYCDKGTRPCQAANYHADGTDTLFLDMWSYVSGINENVYNAWFDLNNVKDVYVRCKSGYDCKGSYWTIVTSNVKFDCVGSSACAEMKIYAYDAIKIDFECDGYGACHSHETECPSTSIDACKYNCHGGEYSCAHMDFYTGRNSINGFLKLMCDSQYPNSCEDVTVSCTFGLIHLSTPIYNGIFGTYCGNQLCCPL